MSALAIVAAALLLFSARADVVARVDGTAITSEALLRRVATSPTGVRPDRILGTMIDEALLTAEGRRLALERSPAATARFETLQRMEAGTAFLAKEIAGRVSVDDAMLRRMFHSTADFAAFDLLTFPNAEQAAAALGRIKKGGSFAAEAPRAITSTVNTDPKTAPLVMRAQIFSPLADALFAAEPQALAGPVQLAEGFGIARLLKKVIGTDADFQAGRTSLASHARESLTQQMKSHVLAKLREQDRVKLDEAFLRSVEDVEPTRQQLEHVIASPGGKPLLYGDVFDTVRAIRATGGHMGPALRISVAWQAVDARLLENVAVERGFLKAPEVVALRAEHEAAAVGYAAMKRVMDAAPPPTKEEIAQFYERNSAAFQRPLSAVKAQAAAGAAREKRELAHAQAVEALRKKANISVDRDALARALRPDA